MRLIDLTRPIVHREVRSAGFPLPFLFPWSTHEQSKRSGRKFSFQSYILQFSDHQATHLDAPHHFDPDPEAPTIDEVPLEHCYTRALCINLPEVGPAALVELPEIQEALARDGLRIEPGDTVLFYMGHHRRWGTPEYFSQHPGLAPSVVIWLSQQGVVCFGVEGPNPGHPADDAFLVHAACRDTGLMHIEGLCNLDKVAGQRFRFAGFPLKLQGASGSPIRAVAILED